MFADLFDVGSLVGLLGALAGLQAPLPDVVPLFPSPPGWQAYVNFLEHTLDFLAKTFSSAGIAVIVFTILIKTLLLPLTVKSIRSSSRCRSCSPRSKSCRRSTAKTVRVSSRRRWRSTAHQVNPITGCLPMLIQAPIFFGLYRAIDNLSNGKGPTMHRSSGHRASCGWKTWPRRTPGRSSRSLPVCSSSSRRG